jgi:predicted ATPase
VNHVPHRVVAERQPELARLDLGQVEHVVDQPQKMATIRAGALETVPDRRRHLAEDVVQDELGIAQHGVQWRAELVAHVGEELRFVPAREEELAEASTARRTLEDLSCGARSTAFVLTPLSRADTAQLVRALTRIGTDAPTVARLEDHVWAMSEGNPFIAVEVTRALDQDNALALPTRVRDLVARRLDRLSTRSQQLVAVAAVIGRRFDFSLVRAASGMEEHDAAEAVEEAVRLRVLETVGDDLDFAHDRIRDVAYDRLLPLRRRLLHRAVVEALEALRREHRGEQIEQFAQHALRGELPEKAVHYLRQAGSRAVVRSALQDARVWLEQALATAETVPESSSTLEQAFAIRLELASVLTHLGEAGRVLEHLSEAETLAERLHDDARRGHVLAILSVTHSLVARLDEALVTGTAALEIARRLEDLKLGSPRRRISSSPTTREATTSGSSSWPPTISRRFPPAGTTNVSDCPCRPRS